MLIGSLIKLARNRFYFYPPRLIRVAWSLARNLRRQLEIFRILSLPLFNELVLLDPVFPFKYLSTDYLFAGLPAGVRAASFVHHYRLIEAKLPSDFLRQRRHREITLFETRKDGCTYAVVLGFPTENAILEGELCLHLLVDGVQVYVLQFTIVPGWVLKSEQEDVALILRLQGMKGHFQQIRSATKALNEVAPPALLVAALQGIASAWGVREMAGICARSQLCYKDGSPDHFRQSYDEFFVELGATHTAAHFFCSPLPLIEKPVDRIRNGHKSRTRKKRAFKLHVAHEVCSRINANLPQVAVAHKDPLQSPSVKSAYQAPSSV
jgi:uncharacterized protein VirK/YbjX